MPDWTRSMKQTFKYCLVDPGTWKDVRELSMVTSCSISRDDSSDTRGSATIDLSESIGECYIRTYMVVTQDGITEQIPLGTHLVQTPSLNFDGRRRNISADAYTPLVELSENPTPLGYSLLKGDNIMDDAYRICREQCRAPVVKAEASDTLFYDFVSNSSDTYLTFCSDLIANAEFHFDVDEMGRVLFAKDQDAASLQPVWTYDDGNSSILQPSISMDRDLYGIPNVVEVVYTKSDKYYYARVVNDDSNSPISTVNRGRLITSRITDPELAGDPTEEEIQLYAENVLRKLSSLECTISYTHGYCPVRVGDCVRLNYERAGLTDIKAKVTSQTIKCQTGCMVTEKATFTTKLWEG